MDSRNCPSISSSAATLPAGRGRPLGLSQPASAAAFSIALIDHQPRWIMLLAASVLALMVLMMAWLMLVIAPRLWCDRHPYFLQPSTGVRAGQLNP